MKGTQWKVMREKMKEKKLININEGNFLQSLYKKLLILKLGPPTSYAALFLSAFCLVSLFLTPSLNISHDFWPTKSIVHSPMVFSFDLLVQ